MGRAKEMQSDRKKKSIFSAPAFIIRRPDKATTFRFLSLRFRPVAKAPNTRRASLSRSNIERNLLKLSFSFSARFEVIMHRVPKLLLISDRNRLPDDVICKCIERETLSTDHLTLSRLLCRILLAQILSRPRHRFGDSATHQIVNSDNEDIAAVVKDFLMVMVSARSPSRDCWLNLLFVFRLKPTCAR